MRNQPNSIENREVCYVCVVYNKIIHKGINNIVQYTFLFPDGTFDFSSISMLFVVVDFVFGLLSRTHTHTYKGHPSLCSHSRNKQKICCYVMNNLYGFVLGFFVVMTTHGIISISGISTMQQDECYKKNYMQRTYH